MAECSARRIDGGIAPCRRHSRCPSLSRGAWGRRDLTPPTPPKLLTYRLVGGRIAPRATRQEPPARRDESEVLASNGPVLATQCAHAAKLADVVGNEHRADGYRVRGDDRVEAPDGTPRFLQRSTYFTVWSLDGAIDG